MPKIKGQVDYILIFILVALILFGILILSAASSPFSLKKTGNPNYFLFRQLTYGLIPGLILGFLAFKIPLVKFKKWSFVLLLINILILAFVFLPKIGLGLRGASRWINLGLFSFQPSEFLKISSIIYFAAWLSRRKNNISKVSYKHKKDNERNINFFAFLVIIGLIGLLLVFQPDISTLGIIVLVAIAMYFLADTPLWYTILIILIGFLLLGFLIYLAPYRMARLLVFLNPETDPIGIGYQIKQAQIAIGSGGIFGLGLGMSSQKFGFLPQSMSDSIFAIFSEETGFVGSFILLSLFLLFAFRGFRIAKKSQDKFLKLLSFGVTFWITIQAFVDIGSMIGILPLTGIPLPFISYGGSALVSELIGVGLLLNISRF